MALLEVKNLGISFGGLRAVNGFDISIEKEAGKTDTVLWYDAIKYIIPISDALSMLNEIEMYALNCYNVTQSHIAAVRSLQTIKEVENYNFKVGYPEKLNFPGYPT